MTTLVPARNTYRLPMVKAPEETTKAVFRARMPAGLTQLRAVYPGGGNYQRWGAGDNYPQLMLEAINGSSTGAACVDTKAKYIVGNGFADANFYQAVVNRQGLKLDSMLALHGYDLASLFGCCAVININANGHPCEVLHAPFAQWRPGWADRDGVVRWDFIVKVPSAQLQTNTQGATGSVKYWRYNPQETPAQRVARILQWCADEGKLWQEYPGELAVYYHKRSGALNHPRPLHDACLRDMMTESSLKISRHSDVRNGFAAQAQITEYGNPKPSKDKLKADVEKYGEFIGEDATRLVVQYALDKTTKPDVDIFTVNDASKRYAQDEDALRRNIRAMFLLPDILYGEAVAGKLGNAQEFEDAVLYATRLVVNGDQRAIEMFYKGIFSQFVPIPDEGQAPIQPGQFNASGNYTVQNLSLREATTEAATPTKTQKTLAILAGLPVLLANKLLESLSETEIRELLEYEPAQAAAPATPAPAPAPAA